MNFDSVIAHVLNGVTKDALQGVGGIYIHVGGKLRELEQSNHPSMTFDPNEIIDELIGRTPFRVNGVYVSAVSGEEPQSLKIIPMEPELTEDFLADLTYWSWGPTTKVAKGSSILLDVQTFLLELGYVTTQQSALKFVELLVARTETISLPFCSIMLALEGTCVRLTWGSGTKLRNRDVAIHLEHIRRMVACLVARTVSPGTSAFINVGDMCEDMRLKLTRKACTTVTRFLRVSPTGRLCTKEQEMYEVKFEYAKGHGNVQVTVSKAE